MQTVEFEFACLKDQDATFRVLSFHGVESIDSCFAFDISLTTAKSGFDPDALLGKKAYLEIAVGSSKVRKYGVIDVLHVLRVIGDTVYLDVILVPQLQRLGLSHNYRTFIDQELKDVLTNVLQENDLQSSDFEFRLNAAPPKTPYLCQYNESDMTFFTRRLEHNGLSYFFEYTENGDKLVVADSIGSRQDVDGDAAALRLMFAPAGSTQAEHGPGVNRLSRKVVAVPAKVRLTDWNYERLDLKLEAEHDVAATGFGEAYTYGDAAASLGDVKQQALFRAQSQAAKGDRHIGISTSPLILPAQKFSLQQHPLDACNTDYIPLRVEHWGVAEEQGGADAEPAQSKQTAGYRNRFAAVCADQQYRPLHDTQPPKVCGGVHAFVEAEGDTYAHLDDAGRYHVKFGFDAASRGKCKSSAPVRMMSPHAGVGYGLHFPLLGGAEVLMGHEQGDPDRPFIMGALPNVKATGPVVQKNTSQAHVHTPGGNKLKFEDKEGASGLMLFSPMGGAGIGIGAPPATLANADEASNYDDAEPPPQNNDASGDDKDSGKDTKDMSGNYFDKNGFNFWTSPGHELSITAKHSATVICGVTYNCYLGLKLAVSAGVVVPSFSLVTGNDVSIFAGSKTEFNTIKVHNIIGKKVACATRTRIKGVWDSLRDNLKSASENEDGTVGDEEGVVDKQTDVRGEESEGTGDENSVKKSEKNLVENKDSVEGQVEEANESERQIVIEISEGNGEDTQLTDSEDDMGESRNRETGNEIHVFGEDTDTHENFDAIKGNTAKVAGENGTI